MPVPVLFKLLSVDEQELIRAEKDLSQLLEWSQLLRRIFREVSFGIPDRFRIRSDTSESTLPQILIAVQNLVNVDDKINGLPGKHINRRNVQFDGFLVDLCRGKNSRSGTDNEGSNSVTGCGFMNQAAGQRDSHGCWRCPPTNCSTLAIIPRVSACRRQLNPSQCVVRMGGPA
ncbi:MAG: hypothetical protein ACK58T_50875, partial [Phycisphaerae bacterium]